MSLVRTIHVKKEQYFVSMGDTGGNSTPFTETSSGILESEPLSYLPTNIYGQSIGYLLTASRPPYTSPPNSVEEGDSGLVDAASGRVFYSSSETLKFSLIESYFKTILQGNILITEIENKLRNQDWWRRSWTKSDPFCASIVSNYDYFLGNILNYIDVNFPKEMNQLTLILWMNQFDGTVHLPLVIEGAAHPGFSREFKTYTI